MATARIIAQPQVLVRVIQPDGGDVVIRAQAAAIVRIVTPGVQGPQGAPGANGAQPQRINASLGATWILPHSLGRVPLVQVFLGDGELVIADVSADATQITVTHASPRSGFVIIN